MACPTQNMTSRPRLELTGFRLARRNPHCTSQRTHAAEFREKGLSIPLLDLRSRGVNTHRALQLGVSTPLVVVHPASMNPFRQTQKVVQHVPIVGAQGRRKFSFQRRA